MNTTPAPAYTLTALELPVCFIDRTPPVYGHDWGGVYGWHWGNMLHNETEPATSEGNWMQNGVLHRQNGPATPTGEWYFYGIETTEEIINRFLETHDDAIPGGFLDTRDPQGWAINHPNGMGDHMVACNDPANVLTIASVFFYEWLLANGLLLEESE